MNPRAAQPQIRRATLTPAARGAMTTAVLAQTSGSACQRAAELLGGQFDAPFDQQTAALVAGHLDHCDSCRALERTLADVRPVLSALVGIEPGPEFAAEVLAVTSRRRVVARHLALEVLSRRFAWTGALAERVAVAWQRLLARPRLSIELAYLATVLLVIVVGNPGLIADALGARTVGVVAGETAGSSTGAGQPGGMSRGIGSVPPTFVARALRDVQRAQSGAAKGWNWFIERTSQLFSASWDWLRDLLRVDCFAVSGASDRTSKGPGAC